MSMVPPRRPLNQRPNPDALIYHLDNPEGRDAIRWVHNYLRTERPRLPQSMFWWHNNHQDGEQYVQIYTDLRPRQMFNYRVQHQPGDIRAQLYNAAANVIQQRGPASGREIEILSGSGRPSAHILIHWDFEDESFQQALGADLIVRDLIQITIIRSDGTHAIIMTMTLDQPNIY